MPDFNQSGRLLYVSSADLSIGNGPGVNELEFVTAMHKAAGDRVHFLLPEPEGELPAEVPKEACTFCHPHKSHHPYHFWRHTVSQARAMRRLLEEHRPDLIVCRVDVLPFGLLWVTRRTEVPYVIKTLGRGAIQVLHDRGGGLGRLLRGLNRRLFQSIVSGAKMADSCSELHVGYFQDLLELPTDRVVWIDNAVNTDRFRPRPKEDARKELGLENFDPIVGYVGSRPWERGGSQLVEVAPRLVEKYPNIGFVIVGAGAPVGEIKARAAELGVDGRIRFEGYVPFAKIPTYVGSLDVGVSISIPHERQVNSELKVRQYLASGKPIVISPGGNDFVPHEGFGSVVEPLDLDSITEELDRWLSLTEDERAAFSQRVFDYMHRNLSMDASIARRFALWNERLVKP